MLAYVLAFAIPFAGSLLATPVVRQLARRGGFVAKVRKDRWHRKPTALMGGIGIYVAFLLGFAWLRWSGTLASGGLLVACSSAMFLLGLVDDLLQLKPYTKLVVQLVAAVLQTAFGLSLEWTPWPLLNQALTVFWLVGVTNALNLLDNIDGLAAGVSVIAAVFMAALLAGAGIAPEAQLALVLAGSAAGFLVYNFNPASIFMGDSGSLFLGFFLGGATLYQGQQQARSGHLAAVLGAPVVLLAIPILDTTLVTITRKLAGRPISQGGRDHASHRLVELGLSERNATLTLYALAIVAGLVGLAAGHVPESVGLALLPTFVLTALFVVVFLARVKVYRAVNEGDEPAVARTRLPTFAGFAYKRRVVEVLNDFALAVLAYYGAFVLRFDGEWVQPHFGAFTRSLPLVVGVQLVALLASGLYGGLWRYTSLAELRKIGLASAVATLGSTLAVLLVFGSFEGFSRAMFVIDGLLLFLGIAGTRLSFRIMRDWLVARQDGSQKRRVLVYGAGDAGELCVRELHQNRALGMLPVGFVDDDAGKLGVVIHGVAVLGDVTRLAELLELHRIHELVISTRRLGAERREHIESSCAARQVRIRELTIGWR